MIKKMLLFFTQYPLYILLLPLFFVIHGYNENYGLIAVSDMLVLLAGYCIAAIVLNGVIYFIYRNVSKAAVVAGLLLCIYFFFGAIHDFLETHSGLWHRYSILLPLFLLIIIAAAQFVRKTVHGFSRANLFFNCLLLIYIFADAAGIAWKTMRPESNSLFTGSNLYNEKFQTCNTCTNPDIYFLLFDEYSSTVNLKQTFQFNNAGLDSFLLQQGFYIQPHSFSNYNFTPFSVGSILNMNYINGIKNADSISLSDYTNCERLIRDNEVIGFLSARNYSVRNYSIFDLAGNPSSVEVSLLPVKTKLITEQTLFHRLWRDIGWHFMVGRFSIGWIARDGIYTNLHLNNSVFKNVQEESRTSFSQPRFVYAHFEMPHWPFYYNSRGVLRNEAVLKAEQSGVHIASYTDYLPYTNGRIKELVNTIMKNTRGSAVIIIMGDHGYRVNLKGVSRDHYFQNFNAVYFPAKNYALLKDSISGVNQFRVILNSLFNQSLPLLKDSSVFLTDFHPLKK